MASPSAIKAVEECRVLVGRRRGRIWHLRQVGRWSGEPAQVSFDGAWALAREERRGDVLGFLHTHPGFTAKPSRRDVLTMRAWASAFGKPLVCLIRGSDGLQGYRFDDEHSDGSPLAAIEEFPRGILVGVDAHGRKISSRRALSRARAR